MEQTYKEAVEKAVKWWSEKAFKTDNNWYNGDAGSMTHILANTLSNKIRATINDAQILIFEQTLKDVLLDENIEKWRKRLDVDYHPSYPLAEALKQAQINPNCMPCKTFMTIDENNVVRAAYQYHGELVII